MLPRLSALDPFADVRLVWRDRPFVPRARYLFAARLLEDRNDDRGEWMK